MDKRNGLRYAFRIAVGITLLVLLLWDSAGAATITVPTDYFKIHWAIDNATVGEAIEVHSSIYNENVKCEQAAADILEFALIGGENEYK